jgi:hypothetical protein
MAEPNPDDGLVPEISELYKRNPAQWTKEAERRTKLDATVEKLEQLESDEKETKHDDDDNVKNEKEADANIAAATGSNNSDKNAQKKAASSITNNNDANPLEYSSENKRKFKKLKSSK